MKSEKEIENYLVKRAAEYGILYYKFLSFKKGIPDRILVGLNRTVFVECKREDGGVLSAMQKKVIRDLKGKNCPVYVIDSFEKADELIETFHEAKIRQKRGE